MIRDLETNPYHTLLLHDLPFYSVYRRRLSYKIMYAYKENEVSKRGRQLVGGRGKTPRIRDLSVGLRVGLGHTPCQESLRRNVKTLAKKYAPNQP